MQTVETKIEKNNFVVLSKFGENKIEPSEMIRLCLNHYEKDKEKFKDYEIAFNVSSIPHVWCEECTPDAPYYF
jgi:hypothetical protein